MKRSHTIAKLRRPSGALVGACAVLQMVSAGRPAAAADDPAVVALTQPISTIEVGGGNVSNGSYKFGEYNGLENRGGFGVGSLDVSGGGLYDSDSAARWNLRAHDIGLKASDSTFEFRDQGVFKIDLGYSDWQHNLSDTYQSPYSGLGTTDLSLPEGWLKPVVPQVGKNLNFRGLSPVSGQGSVVSPAGLVVAPTAAQLSALDGIVALDTGAFHPFNFRTERKAGEVGFHVNLNRSLLLSGSWRHETKDGFRPIGAVTSAVQENSVTLPNVIDTTTDQINLGLEYTHKKFFLQGGYYGSFFKNSVDGMSWQDPNDATRTAEMSSQPGNQFHQFNVAAGLTAAHGVRVVADLSYARSMQNAAFLSDASLPIGLPETSANALAVTKLASVKITAHPTSKLGLSARYRYDDRDNRTPVDTFVFYDVNIPKGANSSAFNSALGLPAATLSSNVNIFANRPQSKKVNEFNLGGDYALGREDVVSGGFDWQKIERTCDGSWINCTNAPESIERTFRAAWRAELLPNVQARASYGYSERRVRYDSNAWLALVPSANIIPGGPIVGATTSVYGYLQQTGLTGFGPQLGYPTTPLTGSAALFSPNNNIVPQSLYGSRDNVSELPGMRRFNLADRNRDKLRLSMDWQPTERLSLTDSFEYDNNDYLHSLYGLQKSSSWTLGLDATYAISDRFVTGAFFAHENQRSQNAGDGYVSNSNTAFVGRAGNTLVDGTCFTTVQSRNNNAKIDPCLQWNSTMRDRADTAGLNFGWRGLWAHRLDLTADVVYSRAVTYIDVNGGSYANNPFALAGAPVLSATTPAALLIPAANMPPVMTRTLEFRLGGRITLTESSDLRVAYEYARTKIEDFAYQGLQLGTGTEQLPTLEQSPNYVVQVVAAYYRYRF